MGSLTWINAVHRMYINTASVKWRRRCESLEVSECWQLSKIEYECIQCLATNLKQMVNHAGKNVRALLKIHKIPKTWNEKENQIML